MAQKLKRYKTVYRGGEGEIVEKKSRFIAHIEHVESEEEALLFIEAIRKEYWDARHNCHAFVIGLDQEMSRCSDDGEPAQTAGKPMLDVLLGRGLKNTIAVVTRYFGGTLLGTGGLVRAYSQAVQAGLEECVVIEKYLCRKIRIEADYTLLGKLQYIAGQMSIMILDTIYTDKVEMILLVPEDDLGMFEKKVTEATQGKVIPEKLEFCYGAEVEGKVMVFPD